jgi:arylsulfatase A
LGGPGFLPEDQGYDTNIAGGHIGHPASFFWPYGKPGGSHRVPELAERGGKEGDYLTDHLTDEAVQFIEAHRERPFFLQFWHYTVHSPLQAKPELVEKYSRLQGSNGQSNAVYAAMIESMDDSLGRIVATLERLGLSENSIIVFTSDNGGAVHFGKPPATSNLPLRMGKGFAYEGGLRVPLVVKAPGVAPPGSSCSIPVISHDFFPTLLELAGAPKSATRIATDGKSFVSLLRGGPNPTHEALFWHYPHYWNRGVVTPYSVARVGEWKLIRFHEFDREELYNLAVDPTESNNLSANHPKQRRAVAARLDKWLRQTGAQMPVERPKPGI